MPTLTVIAGPNGSGKSTITKFLSFEGSEHLLDPDAVARALNPLDPLLSAISAGRQVVRQTSEYLIGGLSFAVETTLSSRRTFRLMCDARSRGYRIDLVFIGLDSPERCISRIRNRSRRVVTLFRRKM